MKLYRYRARIVRIVDADTVIASLDLGLHCFHTESLRVAGVNAPEVRNADPTGAGRAAVNFVIMWIAEAEDNALTGGWPFEIETMKDRQTFGRYVAHIIRADTGESLATALVAAGHAVVSIG